MIDASRTTLTLASGRGLNLLDPKPADIDFAVIGEHLAKANRYCGATPGTVYSVAEHSVRCARLAWAETGSKTVAAYLLCHDMHEAFLGDDTTPKKKALAAIMESFGVLAGEIEKAFASLTERLDAAIHERAGLAWPPSPDLQAEIHRIDRVLLASEWRDLMCYPPPYDFGNEPHDLVVVPQPHWTAAANLFAVAVTTFLPNGGAVA